ncbi:hypothetical protein C0Q70_13526 [Pomacea canaliculata]|uniref:Methyltransferase type 11 domain-containing protein n=1 Tax=Pomacea canaliculata TaxID=400727 RepID=A0A2T7NXG9_POMCA|nr:uncharacterized protein LOC112569926 [Pomacea canaliculata]PVD25862.1 hypothetical protein C0Q70_13526 [Pomacea canaliculata]
MATIFGIDHKYVAASTLAMSVGVAIYATYRLSGGRRKESINAYYETNKSVNEYLLFHYGRADELLAYEDYGPNDSLDFPKRCAELCLKYYKPNDDVPKRALDVGCAVGRATFELASAVDEAIGIDYSSAFINVCNTLKNKGSVDYSMISEGDLCTEHKAVVPADINRQKAKFQQGDACNLPQNLGQFGIVLAANLLCRLHHPRMFINSLKTLVARGGILVITGPYTWMPEYTDKSEWLGGYKDKEGTPVTTFDTLKKELATCFVLLEDCNLPFLIRETSRKHQWTVAHATVWQRI